MECFCPGDKFVTAGDIRRRLHEAWLSPEEATRASPSEHLTVSEVISKPARQHFMTTLLFQETKCVACNHPLELPTVHFLCRHSFHEHCFHFQSFSDKEDECPACLPDNKKILDIVNSQQRYARKFLF